MEDDTHLLQYRRFFGVLLSILPGMFLVYGLAVLVLFVFDDLMGMFGLGAVLAGFVAFTTLAVWIFVGMQVQKWAEEKPMGTLAGLCSPFVLVLMVFMVWLFAETVLITTCTRQADCPGGTTCQEGRCRDAP